MSACASSRVRKKFRTIGFDLSEEKVASYRRHVDPTGDFERELKAAAQLA